MLLLIISEKNWFFEIALLVQNNPYILKDCIAFLFDKIFIENWYHRSWNKKSS